MIDRTGQGQTTYNVTSLLKQTKDADFTAAVGYSYSADHATPATIVNATMPATAVEGDEIEFCSGDNTGGLKVKVSGTHLKPIRINSSVSLSTSSGFWSSYGPNAALRLRYFASENAWVAVAIVGQWVNDASVRQSPADSTKTLRTAAGAATGDVATYEQLPAKISAEINNTVTVTSTGADSISRPQLAYCSATALVAAYDRSTSLRLKVSSNGGATWGSEVTVVSEGPGNFKLISIGATCYLYWKNATHIRYSKSTDSGATWSAAADIVAETNAGFSGSAHHFDANNGLITWVNQFGSTASFAYTTNGGTNWTTGNIATGLSGANVGACFMHTASTWTVLAVTQYGGTSMIGRIDKTANSGTSWTTPVSQIEGGNVASYGIVQASEAIGSGAEMLYVYGIGFNQNTPLSYTYFRSRYTADSFATNTTATLRIHSGIGGANAPATSGSGYVPGVGAIIAKSNNDGDALTVAAAKTLKKFAILQREFYVADLSAPGQSGTSIAMSTDGSKIGLLKTNSDFDVLFFPINSPFA